MASGPVPPLVALGRDLRHRGLPVGTGRILTFVQGVAALGLTDRDSLYWTGRSTMVASRADLETVKGVGPGLSGKIIEARKAGNFKDWNDLVDRVGGIGPGNASKFSGAGLTVGGTAYAGGGKPDAGAAKGSKAPRTAAAARIKSEKPGKAPAAGKDGGSAS